MGFSEIIAYARVLLREIWLHKFKVVVCGALIGFLVLFIGTRWPVSFETSTTIYADNQNILKPLLEKQAEVTKVQDRVRIVRDVMLSPRILNNVVSKVYGKEADLSPTDVEEKAEQVRGNIKIASLGRNYIKISYSDKSPNGAYNFLNEITDLFIKDSSKTKRLESKEAFQFIDKQVKQYKQQLLSAEEALKNFNAENYDGSNADVDNRIAQLRGVIEDLTLEIGENQTRSRSLAQQLREENRYSNKRYKADIYRERLINLQAKKDGLLLSVKERHPDIIQLNHQIEDMSAALKEAEALDSKSTSSDDSVINPLYEELRSKLSTAKTELLSQQRRVSATERLLEKEYERRRRIATRDAERSEITRDYDITKQKYDEMLERKEKARLSMTINLEGQGVSYKVQEPAQYPLVPDGLHFKQFFIIGLVLAVILPLLIIFAYLFIDPRLRFPGQVKDMLPDVAMLAVIPHEMTPVSKRIVRKDTILTSLIAVLFFAVYVGVGIHFKYGVI